MHQLVRSPVHTTTTTTIAFAAATAIAVAPVALQVAPESLPTVRTDVSLAATTVPPPGALLVQFINNQFQNCSLICPHIGELAVNPAVQFAIIPFTFAQDLQNGVPLLQAIAQTDATVSGAANDALTKIISPDLGLVLPRFQHGVEVGVVGLIDVGMTALTDPGNLLQAINTARNDLIDAAQQPPGPQGPAPVHSQLEAAAVRALEVGFAVTFQAPERLLLGVTQAADAFFTTVGSTGNLGTGFQAVATSVQKTLSDSATFINHAVTEPIPITPKAATTAFTPKATTPAVTPKAATLAVQPKVPVLQLPNNRQLVRHSVDAADTSAGPTPGSTAGSTPKSSTADQPSGLAQQAKQAVKRAVSGLGTHRDATNDTAKNATKKAGTTHSPKAARHQHD